MELKIKERFIYEKCNAGDEFVVVLPDADSVQAAETAREIRESIRAATFLARWGRSVQVTASFGVATLLQFMLISDYSWNNYHGH